MTRKRLLLSAGAVATVAAAGTLIAGTTLGLFSATQTSAGNTFTAGTLSLGAPVATACTVAHIVPGNSGDCTVAVTTGGSEPADVAIDVAVAHGTVPASVPQSYSNTCANLPATGLYDHSANGLQITLKDANTANSTITTYDISGLTSASSSVTNLLTGRGIATGTTYTYTLHWSMATNGCVDNNYQGASSTFTFNVHSAQAVNQPTDTTTPGSADGTLVWS